MDITLSYKTLYRSTESGNWQSVGAVMERQVTKEQFETMKNNCAEIGMTYSERYNEFFMVNADRLHATKIIVKEL